MTPQVLDDLPDLSGRTVNERYLLRELIGSGGFGGVFLTEQHVLGRRVRNVACKVSRKKGITEETAGELFADVLLLARAMEAMADAESRQHLVHVYDGGISRELGDRAFLVMEYVPGRSLADEFAAYPDGRVPPRQLLKWARQICVALRGLHSQAPPLVHRDLKPDNVLLGVDKTVRLIDFGLAARMLEGGQVPGTAGTLRYMAPETAAGASVPASDLYSLGLLIFEGLTGRIPYEHLVPPLDLPDALHRDWLLEQKQKEPLPRLPGPADSWPRKLDDLVTGCLRLRPAERLRSVGETITAIDEILDSASSRPAPGEDDLEASRRLRADGAAGEAVSIAERALGQPHLDPRTRYGLLRELAEAHDAGGSPAETARRLAEACEEAGRARLRQDERCELLTRTEQAFRRAGNPYQAERFARLRRAECGGQ